MKESDYIFSVAHMLDECYHLESLHEFEDRREAERKMKRKEKAKAQIERNYSDEDLRKRSIHNLISMRSKLADIKLSSKDSYPLVVISGRPVVLAKIGDTVIPFYCSTGLAGKSKNTAGSGRWYAFFGIGEDGWFNKMHFGDIDMKMHDNWGSHALQAFATQLNEQLGDVRGVFDDTKLDSDLSKSCRNNAISCINSCFKNKPIRHDDHSFESQTQYLNNMISLFLSVNDKKTADKVISAGKDVGYIYNPTTDMLEVPFWCSI